MSSDHRRRSSLRGAAARGAAARGTPTSYPDHNTPAAATRAVPSTPLTAASRIRSEIDAADFSSAASVAPSLAASGITGLGSSFAGITIADTPTYSLVGESSRGSRGSSFLARRTGGTALQFMSGGTLPSTRRSLGAPSPPRSSLGAASVGGEECFEMGIHINTQVI